MGRGDFVLGEPVINKGAEIFCYFSHFLFKKGLKLVV